MSNQYPETDETNPAAVKLFNNAWAALEAELGADKLAFPPALYWLNGAPGAGKGTQTPVILEMLGLTAQPLVMSDLFKTPEMKAIMATGKLIDDETVFGLLLRALLKPEYANGVIVDGFPRSAGQVACLKLFAKKLAATQAKPTKFGLVMLYVGEKESVERQLKRGREMQAAGLPVRSTDVDPEKTLVRYKEFADKTLGPIETLDGVFPYYKINSLGSIEETAAEIRKVLAAAK